MRRVTPASALALPLGGRVLAAAVAIFPLGFVLGMPFPLGILSITGHPRGAVAWAWGMNGALSVLGATLAIFIAMNWGFKATLLTACGTYLLGLVAFWSATQPQSR